MALYKPRPTNKTWWYKFQLGGRPFRADTQKSNKREAEQVEKDARAAAKAALAEQAETARQFRGGEMSIENAAADWQRDFGQFLADGDNQAKYLAWIVAVLGADRLLSGIDDGEVARLVARRRTDESQRGGNRKPGTARKAPPRPVTPATVNRTVLAPLRQVMNTARKKWKVKTGEVDWGSHWLKEPVERPREASIGEESAIIGELERGYDDAIRFALLSGCRIAEIVSLTWNRVNFFAGELYIIGKGDKARTIPMTKALRGLLEPLRGHHAEYVFTYVARATRPAAGLERGQRYPIRYWGLQSAMRRGVDRAGVADFHMHDTRHTQATRTLRASGNLRVVKELLGHADIKTTMRYAHVLTDDIRRAMEASEAAAAAATASAQLATQAATDLAGGEARAESGQQSGQQASAASAKHLVLVKKSA